MVGEGELEIGMAISVETALPLAEILSMTADEACIEVSTVKTSEEAKRMKHNTYVTLHHL